ncbi:MAG: hypothetical protein HY731_13710 [Candidatus Tectomicrobia bacterium]|nr:hypothetical protein [Candidatus Tectomicrobia bacterium]
MNRKQEFIRITRENQDRYDKLNEDRMEFYSYYRETKFDLLRLKQEHREVYEKLIHWETRYYWFCFYEYFEGHVRKSVPKEVIHGWDRAIVNSLKNPVHRQAWEQVVRQIDFWGYSEFNRFIDQCLAGHCVIGDTKRRG